MAEIVELHSVQEDVNSCQARIDELRAELLALHDEVRCLGNITEMLRIYLIEAILTCAGCKSFETRRPNTSGFST